MSTTIPAAPYAFVSYASADRERVLPLVDALPRASIAVWLDREGIRVRGRTRTGCGRYSAP